MATDSRIGTVLAGYRIESLLGRGGMSSVYLAEHVGLKRKVALKVLAPELAEDERFRERFVRESQLAASLEDPNVIPIHEAGEVAGVLYIAMRYVEGTDLKGLIEREGPLAPERTAAIVAQVASALDAAHARGLVHRDVKPANILIVTPAGPGRTEHVYLSDFGLTKRAASDSGITGTGQFVGTLDYAAPEQFEGRRLDARTDVYSLGCVLYESLAGTVPFPREQDPARMYAHLNDAPPSVTALRPELPPRIDAVVARAMAKKPQDRYPSAGDLAADAGRALRPAQTPPTGPGRGGRRGLLLPAFGAIALVAVVVGLVLTRGGDAGSPDPTRSVTPSTTVSTSPSATASATGAAAPPPGSLVEIDPEAGETVTVVPDIPGVVKELAVGEGGVWALSFTGRGVAPERSVLNYDTRAAQVRDPIRFVPFFGEGSAMAVGFPSVWLIGVDAAGRVSRINPATGERLPPLSFEGEALTDAVLGGGALWVGAGDGTLRRIDPLTGRVILEIELRATPDKLAFGAGSAWALDVLAGEVLRVDRRAERLLDRIRVAGTLTDIAAGDGGVWLLDDLAGTAIPIDPAEGTAGNPLPVGSDPSAITVGLGAAWVTDETDGMIYRVDPATRQVTTIDVGAPLAAIAVDPENDTVWVAILP